MLGRTGLPWQGYGNPVNHVSLALINAPTVEPVTATEIKRYLRLGSNTDEDPTVDMMAIAARQRLESWLRRALITQTWDMLIDWAPAWIELPWPPIQSIVGIWVTGVDNSETLVDPVTYYFKQSSRLVGLNVSKVWPVHITPQGFRIRFVAGYGDDPSSVPAAIKMSLLNMVSYAYDDRMTINEVPQAEKASLNSYQIKGAPFRLAKGMEPREFLA